jgi:CDP-2,3-bis-(O-geranylgeranyl)-sn-glycerol synthase
MMVLLSYIWLLLPAGVANMIPPLAAKLWPNWTQPIDMNIKFRGKRVMGDHKTVRGLVVGVSGGWLIFILQKYVLHSYLRQWELYDYSTLPIYTGFLLAFGALAGDAIKSFFKRQAGVASGKSWFPWDQIDWILGMIICFSLVGKLTILDDMILVGSAFTLHLLVKAIGYVIKANETII